MPVSLTNGARLQPVGDLNLRQTVRFPDLPIHTKPPLTDTRGGPLTEITKDGAAVGMKPPTAGQLIINSCPFSVNWRLSCPVSELDSGTPPLASHSWTVIFKPSLSADCHPGRVVLLKARGGEKKKGWLMDRETGAAHTELTSTGHL